MINDKSVIPYNIAKINLRLHFLAKGIDIDDPEFDAKYAHFVEPLHNSSNISEDLGKLLEAERSKQFNELIRPDLNDEQFDEHMRGKLSARAWKELQQLNESLPPGQCFMLLTDENGHATCNGKGCGKCASCYDRHKNHLPLVVGIDPYDYIHRLENAPNPSISYLTHAQHQERIHLGLGAPRFVSKAVMESTDRGEGFTYFTTRDYQRDIDIRMLDTMRKSSPRFGHTTSMTGLVRSGGFRRGELSMISSLGYNGQREPRTSHLTDLIRTMANGSGKVLHVCLEQPVSFWQGLRSPYLYGNPEDLFQSFSPFINMKKVLSKPFITLKGREIHVGGKKVPGYLSIPETLRYGRDWFTDDYFYDSRSPIIRPWSDNDCFGYQIREDWAEEAIDKMIWLREMGGSNASYHFNPRSGGFSIVNYGKPFPSLWTKRIKEAARERLRKVTEPEKPKRGY